MAAPKSTLTGKIKLKKPQKMIVELFNGSETDNEPLGEKYSMDGVVVRDQTSLSQDDNETTNIEDELSDTPLDTVVTMGAWQFSAQVASFAADILKDIAGFKEATVGSAKVYAAPSSAEDRYARVTLCYNPKTGSKGTEYYAVVVPKLKLNSRIVLESLNSQLGYVNLAGTAEDVELSATLKAPIYTNPAYVIPTA